MTANDVGTDVTRRAESNVNRLGRVAAVGSGGVSMAINHCLEALCGLVRPGGSTVDVDTPTTAVMTCSELAYIECPPRLAESRQAVRRHRYRQSLPCGADWSAKTFSDSPQHLANGTRMRNFVSTKHGRIVNRGDSFCQHSSRPDTPRRLCYGGSTRTPPSHRQSDSSNRRSSDQYSSRACASSSRSTVKCHEPPVPSAEAAEGVSSLHRVLLLGTNAVGKSTLIDQFQTSEHNIDCVFSTESSQLSTAVTVKLNDNLSELHITEVTCADTGLEQTLRTSEVASYNALVLVYSVIDEDSFDCARKVCELMDCQSISALPVILVANKCDLVRLRKVSSKEGRSQAIRYGFKYVETSVVIGSNIDELLAGIVAQTHIYDQSHKRTTGGSTNQSLRRRRRRMTRTKSRTLPATALKDLFLKFIGVSESKSCQNLLTL